MTLTQLSVGTIEGDFSVKSARFSVIAFIVLCLAAFIAPASTIAAPSPALTVGILGTQGSACSSTDTSKVLLWENRINDTSDGNDNLWKCGGDPTLSDDSHTIAGDCHAGVLNRVTWNDCVDSVTVWVPSGYSICFYGNSNYSNSFGPHKAGPVSNYRFNLGVTDGLTSFRFVQGTNTSIVCASNV